MRRVAGIWLYLFCWTLGVASGDQESVLGAALTTDPARRLELLEEAHERKPRDATISALLAQQYMLLGDCGRIPALLKDVEEVPELVVARSRFQAVRQGHDLAAEQLLREYAERQIPATLAEYVHCVSTMEKEREWLEMLSRGLDLPPAGSLPRTVRDIRLLAARSAVAACDPGLSKGRDFESLLWQVLESGKGDAPSLFEASKLLVTLASSGSVARARTALRKLPAELLTRTDVRLWTGVIELTAYGGNVGLGWQLLQSLPATPTVSAGPALLSMARVALGYHCCLVRDYAAASRYLSACASDEGWYHGLLCIDALAAGGKVKAARRFAARWGSIAHTAPTSAPEPYLQAEAELRAFEEGGGSGGLEPPHRRSLVTRWNQQALQGYSRGADEAAYRFVSSSYRIQKLEWIDSVVRSGIGFDVHARAAANGAPRELMAAIAKAQANRAKTPPPEDAAGQALPAASAGGDLPSFAFLIPGLLAAAGAGLLWKHGKTMDSRWRDRLAEACVAGGLLTGLLVFQHVDTSGQAPAAKAADSRKPPADGGPESPHEVRERLLAEAGVPLEPVTAPTALVHFVDAGSGKGQGRFVSSTSEQRGSLLRAGGASAFDYLMQRLARGPAASREIAAALLAQHGDARAIPLLRYEATQHVIESLRRRLGRLTFTQEMGEGLPSACAVHREIGCQLLRALESFDDVASIPLLLDALDGSDAGLWRSAQRGLIKLTGAVGARSAWEWRRALESRAYRGRR